MAPAAKENLDNGHVTNQRMAKYYLSTLLQRTYKPLNICNLKTTFLRQIWEGVLSRLNFSMINLAHEEN